MALLIPYAGMLETHRNVVEVLPRNAVDRAYKMGYLAALDFAMRLNKSGAEKMADSPEDFWACLIEALSDYNNVEGGE